MQRLLDDVRGNYPAIVSVQRYNAIVERLNTETRGRKAAAEIKKIEEAGGESS